MRKSAEVPPLRPRARTLRDGVLEIFSQARRAGLQQWEARLRDEARRAPEPLLFVALLCGTQYRVFHLEPGAVSEELRQWLTSSPRNMNEKLAEVLLEAIAPVIEKSILARPWQRGPEGIPAKVTGRPVETHGAWVAGVLVERHLANEGVPEALALSLGKSLVSVLMNRPTAGNAYYQVRKRLERGTSNLLAEILRVYGSLRATEARRRLDPEPQNDKLAYAKWRAWYKDLLQTVAVSGADRVAREALKAIPATLWTSTASPPATRGRSTRAPKRSASRNRPRP